MLKEGKYPWPLKQRILSKKGHLSNEAAGITLKEVLKGEREVVLLGHLSKENNIPLLAYNTVKNIIESTGINIHKDIILDLTYRDRTTKVYNL
jgi:phosphoribosyl 1,2-cyclic phosphodiesterase